MTFFLRKKKTLSILKKKNEWMYFSLEKKKIIEKHEMTRKSQQWPSMTLAQISAPTPNWGQPPSTVTRWLVFITLVSIQSTSRGRIVRRLITWHKDTQEVVKRLLSTGNLCDFTKGVFVPLPHTRFLPWRGQRRHPGSDWHTESEWP